VRVATVAGAAAVAVGIASGCASPGSGIQPGEQVTVYVSMPLRGPERSEGRDAADGARLALADARGRVGDLRVRAVYLDDTSGRGRRARWSPATAAANARRAAEDSTAIAYVGDFDSGATRFSLPITNEARMLQVSPASSAIDLVQPYLDAGDQLPEQAQPSGERTFGRVIPSDEAQAEAGAGWAKRLGARDVIVVGDRSPFSSVVGSAFRAEARALGLTTGRSHGGSATPCGVSASLRSAATYYAGERAPGEGLIACALAPAPHDLVMTTDALLESPAPGAISARAGSVRVSSAAQDPSQLPAAGQRFVRAFRGRYRRAPGRYAAYGYEAMAVVLDSIRRAGSAGDDRDAVVDAFFETRNRHSILGTYSIDDVGDTTLDRMTGYRIAGRRVRGLVALRVP
jgi:branched-chain amino acid transport system substrate-binding protein